MPSDAPAIKRARVEADGAQVVVVGPASATSGGAVAEELAAVARPRDHPALRRRPDHRRPGHGRAGDRRGPADRRRRPRPHRRRRAGQRASRPRSGRSRPDARIIGVEPELAADARDSLASRPHRRAGRRSASSRTIADGTRTQSIGALQLRPPLASCSTTSSPSPRPRSRRRSGSRPRRRGWSSSRRARWPSRRCGSTPREAGLRGLDGPVVAVVSGGNVDPEPTSSYLEAPIPPEALVSPAASPVAAAPGPPAAAASAARRAASLTSRSRIAARSAVEPPILADARGAPRPASSRQVSSDDHRDEQRSPPSHMIPPASCWSSSGVGPQVAAGRRVVRRRAGAVAEVDREGEERVLGHLEADVQDPGRRACSRHGDGSGPTTGHQNSSAATRNSGVLEPVDPRVLEREVEQRREVARPHHAREQRSTRPPGTTAAGRPRSGAPAGSSAAASRATSAWSRSVIGPASSSSGGPTSVSSRCWTMCTENSVVS